MLDGTLTTTGSVIPEVTDTYIFGRTDKRFVDVYAETFYGYLQDNVTDVDKLVSSLSAGDYITSPSDWDGSDRCLLECFCKI